MMFLAFLIAVATIPLMMILVIGGGILGSSGERAKPASMQLGKQQNKSEPLRVDVSKSEIPNACPVCNESWKRTKFGEKVTTMGYEHFQDDQVQCLDCGYLYHIIEGDD
jgi:hypothetical protein